MKSLISLILFMLTLANLSVVAASTPFIEDINACVVMADDADLEEEDEEEPVCD